MTLPKFLTATIVGSLILASCRPTQSQSQPLTPGTWTGQVVGPDGQNHNVLYSVRAEGGRLAIDLEAPGIQVFELREIQHRAQVLTFRWETDIRLDCRLDRQQDASYRGECVGPGGGIGQIAMVPPRVDRLDPGPPETASPEAPFIAGQTYWGENRYIEYSAGDLPLILSVPHGGLLEPRGLPSRQRGYTVGDSNTLELTRAIAQALEELTGQRPHVVISHLARTKLDPNRGVDIAANGNPRARKAWEEYHRFIDQSRQKVTTQWKSGLYLDVHGHGHRVPWVELGYGVAAGTLNGSNDDLDEVENSAIQPLARTTGLPLSELIRGSKSLGGLLEATGYRVVPSPSDPGPHGNDYFYAGYSTTRHGSSFGGSIDSILLEHPKRGVRDSEEDRRLYAKTLATVLVEYLDLHYGHDVALD